MNDVGWVDSAWRAASVPDPCAARGVRHPFDAVVALAGAAMHAGRNPLATIGLYVADVPQAVLEAVGTRTIKGTLGPGAPVPDSSDWALGQHRAIAGDENTTGHPNTHAWVLGIQFLIAYWTGDLTAAARFAAAGTHLATSGATSVRLPSLQARAAAAAGNTTMAITALTTAEARRHRTRDDPDALGGLFDFPESKRAVYTGTTLVTLGGPAHLAQAITESHRAISLYEASASPDVSQPDVLAARLDLATAHLAADELDASAEQTALVLTAPGSGHTASVRKRAASLAAALEGPNAPQAPLARDLAGQLAELAARGTPSADPEEASIAT